MKTVMCLLVALIVLMIWVAVVFIIAVHSYNRGYEEGYEAGKKKKKNMSEKDCYTCKYREEMDGSHCYECIKGMANNYEETNT